MSEMSPELRGRVLPRILADYGFKPSADKKWLNQGKCPACGKKELFPPAENPVGIALWPRQQMRSGIQRPRPIPGRISRFYETF